MERVPAFDHELPELVKLVPAYHLKSAQGSTEIEPSRIPTQYAEGARRSGHAARSNRNVNAMNPAFTDDQSLLPTIAVDATTGKVLMLAYMNREAWQQTLDSGEAVYYSRSRQRLWKKGEQSGHVQLVREIRIDCDADTILLEVDQQGGAACHEGYESCFFRRREGDTWIVDGERIFDPAEVYSKP